MRRVWLRPAISDHIGSSFVLGFRPLQPTSGVCGQLYRTLARKGLPHEHSKKAMQDVVVALEETDSVETGHIALAPAASVPIRSLPDFFSLHLHLPCSAFPHKLLLHFISASTTGCSFSPPPSVVVELLPAATANLYSSFLRQCVALATPPCPRPRCISTMTVHARNRCNLLCPSHFYIS